MSSILLELGRLGFGDGVVSIEGLSHGIVSDTWLVRYEDGTRIVAKTSLAAPPDLFGVEAAGLRALNEAGHIPAADVLGVNEQVLLLPLYEPLRGGPEAWERLGRELAALHLATESDRFGWGSDGYLGWLPQPNPWTTDGYRFYAEHRILRWLNEPLAESALEPADRRAVERLCDRLPELLPDRPPVLTHGDLWSANVVTGADGRLVLIDPAVSYTWAEVDLSMLWCTRRPEASGRAFAAYHEVNPIEPGWDDRARILYLREVLSSIAHLGGPANSIATLRETIAPFR